MVKKFRRYVNSFWQNVRTWQTHTHTHTHIQHDGICRACKASRGRKSTFIHVLPTVNCSYLTLQTVLMDSRLCLWFLTLIGFVYFCPSPVNYYCLGVLCFTQRYSVSLSVCLWVICSQTGPVSAQCSTMVALLAPFWGRKANDAIMPKSSTDFVQRPTSSNSENPRNSKKDKKICNVQHGRNIVLPREELVGVLVRSMTRKKYFF